MKSKFCLLVLMGTMINLLSFAQIEKGNVFFGGSSNLSFSAGAEKVKTGSTTNDGYKYSSFNFQPAVGYFVINRLPVGLFVDLSLSKQKSEDPDVVSSYSYAMIGPFARYYVTDINGFMPFGEIKLAIGSGKSNYEYNGSENEEKYSMTHVSVGAGATYFITENVGIDFLINYALDSEKYDAPSGEDRAENDKITYKYSGIGFKLGFVISLGK